MSSQKVAEKPMNDVEFKLSVFDGLNRLRNENILCDVVLQVDGHSCPAHRNVLSAASLYFKALFHNNMQEKQTGHIELETISRDVIDDVVAYIYTGLINIEAENAREILIAADYLLISSLKMEAASFLDLTISPENALDLRDFAIKYNCQSLAKTSKEYINEHFSDICQAENFNQYSFTDVQDLVSSNDIGVAREDEVLQTVLRWVKHDEPSRKQHLTALLEKVSFFSVSKYTLQACLTEEPMLMDDPKCIKLFLEALQMHLFPDAILNKNVQLRKCHDVAKVIVLVGGHYTCAGELSTNLPVLRIPNNDWYQISTDDFAPRTRHSATVCDGNLYVVGGKEKFGVEQFDPRFGHWSSHGASPTTPVDPIMHAVAVTSRGKIIVIGGETKGRETLNTVSEYDPTFGEWKLLASMAYCRAAHVAACIGNFIYVAGGFNTSRKVYCSGERYNIEKDEWTAIADMQHKRRFAAGCGLRDKLFVAGGYMEAGGNMDGEWIVHSTCEIYDPITGHWDRAADLSIPRAACGIACIEDHVYLFGGENGVSFASKLDSVIRYDAVADVWENIGTMPSARICLQACLMHLSWDFLAPLEY